jgi:tetratricopeptide (TPR) repeat protein
MFYVLLALAVLVVVAVLILRFRGRHARAGEQAIGQAEAQAYQALFAGDAWKAEQVLQRLVEDTAQRYGPRSRLAGKARFALATLLLGMEDYPRAAAVMRAATDIEPVDHASRKDRLTYQMNLGDVLSRMGNHEEAEAVLRQSLDERRQLYGEGHSGYAYGLEALAQVVLRRGRADEALQMADQALRIDRASNNPHLAHDLAVKALALKSRPESAAANCLPEWPDLTPPARTAVLEAIQVLAGSYEPGLMLAVYRDVQACLEQAPSAGDQDRLNAAVAVTNMARLAGDHEARVAAFRQVIELLGDNREQLVGAWLGLALAQNDAGQTAAADDSYREAVRLAEAIGSPAQAAQALRNYALHLDATGRADEAAATHRRAVTAARQAGDPEMLGRALCACGIFFQHRSQFDVALPLLEESLRLLPAAHPDAVCAQSHLTAARGNQSCGCEATNQEALAETLRRLVRERAPAGLVKEVHIDFANQELPIAIEATREPTDAEGRQLYDAVQNALGELRRRSSRVGFGK